MTSKNASSIKVIQIYDKCLHGLTAYAELDQLSSFAALVDSKLTIALADARNKNITKAWADLRKIITILNWQFTEYVIKTIVIQMQNIHCTSERGVFHSRQSEQLILDNCKRK